MPLPSVPLPTGTVEVAGQVLNVKSLSRAQTIEIKAVAETGDLQEVEILMLAFGLGEPREDVERWRQETGPTLIETVVEAIADLSGFELPEKKGRKAISRRANGTKGPS